MKMTTVVIVIICCIIAFGYAMLIDVKDRKSIKGNKYVALGLVCVLAFVATWIAGLQAYVGAPIIGLFLGMIIYNIIPKFDDTFLQGTTYAAKKCLPLGIILVGATLNFSQMAASLNALPLVLFNICLSFGVAFLVGKLVLKLTNNTCTLVGGGTAICGGTAVAALGSIRKALASEIGFAMTAIFLFDIFSCLLYPYLAQWLSLTPEQFSFLAGTAINDTSSVTASALQYSVIMGNDAYATGAVSVKLVRTTMLIVVAIVVTVVTVIASTRKVDATEASEGEKLNIGTTVLKVFPWFIVGFIIAALLNTWGIFGDAKSAPILFDVNFSKFFSVGSKYLITCALVGVGFKMKFKELFTKGIKPLALGGCTWIVIACSSLIFVNVFADYVNSTALFG